MDFSTFEVMACDGPAMVCCCISFPELVVDAKGDFLCRMADVEDFADKTRHLAADEDLRRVRGVFNWKRIERQFTIYKMMKECLGVYQSLIR
jgi:spore maturation protein CgeB